MSFQPLRYAAAACQTDLPNPAARLEMRASTDRILGMIDAAVAGAKPFLPVRLVVFPEFAHAAPVYPTVAELRRYLAVPIPNEHTERLQAKSRELGVYIQSGSMIEESVDWPDVLFNTTCLIGPEGILLKYRKVNPWLPYEVHASPHDLPRYAEPLFPVADTPIGRIGAAICYDWLFPEVLRQLTANGAEVLVRVSAYMDPWGATAPMDWWTVVNRCRAIENLAYVVAANQGARLQHYPPYSWPGGSEIVDFEGRVLAAASPGPGERIVIAPIDITALRHERQVRTGHHMLAHLRAEAYPVYRRHHYPPRPIAEHSYEGNLVQIEARKRSLAADLSAGSPFDHDVFVRAESLLLSLIDGNAVREFEPVVRSALKTLDQAVSHSRTASADEVIGLARSLLDTQTCALAECGRPQVPLSFFEELDSLWEDSAGLSAKEAGFGATALLVGEASDAAERAVNILLSSLMWMLWIARTIDEPEPQAAAEGAISHLISALTKAGQHAVEKAQPIAV